MDTPDGLLLAGLRIAFFTVVLGRLGTVGAVVAEPEVAFRPPITVDAGSAPRTVAVADLNSDAIPDIVTANSGSGDVTVLIGGRDGGFTLGPSLPIGIEVNGELRRISPSDLAASDLNRDGIPDLVVGCENNRGCGTVFVLLGNSDGTLAIPLWFFAGRGALAVVVADFDGDGTPDIAVAPSINIAVLPGHGDGTFGEARRIDVDRAARGLATSDFNGDGIADLVTANAGGDVSVLLGSGDGTFSVKGHFPGPGQPAPVAVADRNSDGTVRDTGETTEEIRSVAVGDFNGDGAVDLVTANAGVGSIAVLLGRGDGSFAAPDTFFLPGDQPAAVRTVDVDGDTVLDVIVADAGSNVVSVLPGTGDGRFGAFRSFSVGQGPIGLAVADLNGDAIPDIVTANSLSDDVSILLAQGPPPGTATPTPTQTPRSSPARTGTPTASMSVTATVPLTPSAPATGGSDGCSIEPVTAVDGRFCLLLAGGALLWWKRREHRAPHHVEGPSLVLVGFIVGSALSAPPAIDAQVRVTSLAEHSMAQPAIGEAGERPFSALQPKLSTDIGPNGDTKTSRPLLGPAVACAGDCDGDGRVNVDELVRAVAIALGDRPVGGCDSLDLNLDGEIGVDELVAAVANALRPCEAPQSRAFLVADARPGSEPRGADPRPIVTIAGTTYFVASTPATGEEIWATDGTAAGTRLLADIRTGAESSRPQWLTAFGEELFFVADDGGHGPELWTSDGTPSGTRLALDVREGPEGSNPTDLVTFRDTLFFAADDGSLGREIWSSDGTEAGTQPIDVLPGKNESQAALLTVVGTQLFFNAADIQNLTELWVTDGTRQGTRRVADINPGPIGSNPFALTPFGDLLFFVATRDGRRGIWVSDGTAAGTIRLRNTGDPFDTDGVPRGMTGFMGDMFFALSFGGGLQPWVTDGTPGGTRLLDDIRVGGSFDTRFFTPAADQLLFKARDAAGPDRLWRTDGTEAGTERLNDLVVDTLAPFDGIAALSADDGVHGLELWISGGTAEGTTFVRDLLPGPSGSHPQQLHDAEGTLFFSADDGVNGRELWTSDGTERGTSIVSNLTSDAASSNPSRLTPTSSRLYFRAAFAGREQLWVASLAGSEMLLDLQVEPHVSRLGEMIGLGDRLYFAFDDGEHGFEIWSTDGAREGTRLVADVNPGAAGSLPMNLTVVGDTLFFSAWTLDVGRELWRSDGTREGTLLVKDTRAGIDDNARHPGPAELADVDGELWFVRAEPSFTTVWRSDGSPEGTVGVTMSGGGNHTHGPNGFTELHGLVYFASGSRLWRSDGTDAGTGVVFDVRNNGFHGPDIEGLMRAGDRLFFTVRELGFEIGPLELWTSDGSSDGTQPLRLFRPVRDPVQLVDLGGKIFFPADDGELGTELWQSDGTREGTMLVADIHPGPIGSFPRDLTVAGNEIAFQACAPTHGCEVWMSDGSPTGTRILADPLPGPLSSDPDNFVAVAGNVFFTADDGRAGRELWALPVGRPSGPATHQTRRSAPQ